MYIPKKYGQSKIQTCPFCGKTAVCENSQCIPVCSNHKNEKLDNFKCVCGEYLEVRKGKFGPYFYCMNCGNINFKKGLEMNPIPKNVKKEVIKKTSEKNNSVKHTPKEITITSEDVEYF